MQVFGYLNEFESFLLEEKKRGRRMIDLYEIVQQAAEILQRLYLMIAVGAIYVKSKEVSSKEIMEDLLEMTKGIQNPIRGLFLRYFMLKKLKDIFPDKSSQYDG